MKIKWLVEKNMFPEYEEQLVTAIKSSGAECYLFDDSDRDFNIKNYCIRKGFNEDDCVIFYGSLNRGRDFYKNTPYEPGIFLTIENYECFKYYGYYGIHHINCDCVFLGLNEVFRRIGDIRYRMNWQHSIFIRPSNGYKTFTGQLLHYNSFEEDFNALVKSYGGLDMDQLILLAETKQVIEESRYIVINGEIIDGSIYMRNGERVTVKEIDPVSLEYAKSMVPKYTPDEIFTLDIAKLSNRYAVLEVNSFCCASIYNGDISKIVDAVNKKVESYYKDFYNITD